GFDYQDAAKAMAAKRLPLIAQAAEHVLQQKDGKPRYLLAVMELSKAFALAVPNDEALEIRDEVGFFQEVRAVLAKSISEGGGKSPETPTSTTCGSNPVQPSQSESNQISTEPGNEPPNQHGRSDCGPN
ncbi:MAG: DUF3387 domain-containing protein, partial [Verrucomicrobia bacterium]|nr:DUF3387 domain-containing protein [Verrucomicrobiota bacterium]